MNRDRYDPGYLQATASVDVTCNTADITSINVTVPGANLGDFAIVSFGEDVLDLAFDAQVTATNTVAVTWHNDTGADVDLGINTMTVRVYK